MTDDRVRNSLAATVGLIKRMQLALVKYFVGPGPANYDLDELIELLDGPEQRAIQGEAEEALKVSP